MGMVPLLTSFVLCFMNGNASLIDGVVKLISCNGNDSLIDEISSWLFIVTPTIGTLVGLVPRGDHLYMVVVQGYDHTLSLARAWSSLPLVEVLPCGSCKPQYGGLLSH